MSREWLQCEAVVHRSDPPGPEVHYCQITHGAVGSMTSDEAVGGTVEVEIQVAPDGSHVGGRSKGCGQTKCRLYSGIHEKAFCANGANGGRNDISRRPLGMLR